MSNLKNITISFIVFGMIGNMKKIIYFAAGIACLLSSAIAMAVTVELTATHSAVSETQSIQGTMIATYNVTVTNNSTSSLTNISVDPIGIGPDIMVIPGTSALFISSLAAGSSATVNWSAELIGPSLLLGVPLDFVGTATDQSAQSVVVIIFSGGM